jgi:ssDNA-binding replication factor A large subunit
MAESNDSLEQHTMADWTDIVHLTPECRQVNVRFSIIKKGVARRVTSKSSGRQHEVSDCIVADSTARINLTLWNEDVDRVSQNRSYCLMNGYVNTQYECMSLSTGHHGRIVESDVQIEITNDKIDMSRPFMGRPKRPRPRFTTSRVLQGTIGREAGGYPSRKSF